MNTQIPEYGMTPTSANLTLWLLWVLATVVASFIGLILCIVIGLMTWGAGLLVAGVIVGPLNGSAQGWVLQRYSLRLMSVPQIRTWLIANAVGGLSSILSFIIWAALVAFYVLYAHDAGNNVIDLLYVLFAIVAASLGFGLFGASQWYVLRQWLPNAVWWIPINVLSGGIAFYSATILLGSLVVQAATSDPVVSIDFILLLLGAVMLLVVVWAALSGVGLIWLLRPVITRTPLGSARIQL